MRKTIMLPNWLRKFHNKIFGRDRTRTSLRQERRACLGVECLEERVVLSGGVVPGSMGDVAPAALQIAQGSDLSLIRPGAPGNHTHLYWASGLSGQPMPSALFSFF